MNTDIRRLVPKMHPLTRGAEPDDPMTLHATPVGGDPEVMLRCIVQEYAWAGWDLKGIIGLFRDPFYLALNSLLQLYGEAGIRDRVTAVLGRSGVLRFKENVSEGPEPADHDDEPQLVQIRIPARLETERLGRERYPWRIEFCHESDDDAFEAETIRTAQRPISTELGNNHAQCL